MSCSLHQTVLPTSNGVRINGCAIPHDLIAREVQQYPSRTPADAWKAAVRALAVRELLLQEAKRLDVQAEPIVDSEGRRETEEEAAIRELVAQEVRTPDADLDNCRRYYERNLHRFRSPDIYEAAHILFAAVESDPVSYAQARASADCAAAILRDQPEYFAELARAHSACPSATQGGNLGQITTGQTTLEFEQALVALMPGCISQDPVATRYGFHIIRLDRKLDGRELPFELVADRIAEYLRESVQRRAMAQYIARLASAAHIEGIDLTSAEALRVN